MPSVFVSFSFDVPAVGYFRTESSVLYKAWSR